MFLLLTEVKYESEDLLKHKFLLQTIFFLLSGVIYPSRYLKRIFNELLLINSLVLLLSPLIVILMLSFAFYIIQLYRKIYLKFKKNLTFFRQLDHKKKFSLVCNFKPVNPPSY